MMRNLGLPVDITKNNPHFCGPEGGRLANEYIRLHVSIWIIAYDASIVARIAYWLVVE